MKRSYSDCENSDDSKFCHESNKPLKSNGFLTICEYCNAPIPYGFEACPSCGKAIPESFFNKNSHNLKDVRNLKDTHNLKDNSYLKDVRNLKDTHNLKDNYNLYDGLDYDLGNKSNFDDKNNLNFNENPRKLIIYGYIIAIVFGWGGVILSLLNLINNFGFLGFLGLFFPGFILQSKNSKFKKHAYIQLVIWLSGIILQFLIIFNYF